MRGCWLALLMLPSLGVADVATLVPQADVVGQGRYTWGPFPLYDATLLAPQGVYNEQQPFALQLNYLRQLSGARIAAVAGDEMRRLSCPASTEQIQVWETALAGMYPEKIEAQERLTGIRLPDGSTRFLHNGKPLGEVADVQFTQCFFAIWLDERTQSPELRLALLGNLK